MKYVDDLFKRAVGAIGFTPDSFYTSSPREVLLAIEGYEDDKQEDFVLMQTATMNAIGVFLGGKQFELQNPFKKQEQSVKEEVTVESKAETFNYLQEKFEQ